jgi:membrane fusion protein, copper/silver efflux system
MTTLRHVLAYTLAFVLVAGLTGCGHKEQGGQAIPGDTLSTPHKEEAADYYTCPMHPSVHSDKPGACPICGMALVKKSTQTEHSADTVGLRSVSLSPTQRIVANVTTVAATRTSLTSEINAVGIVAAAEPAQATVAARFRGRIEKLHVNSTGQKVRKGEPLFELYSPDLISAEQDFLLALQAEQQAGVTQVSGSGSMQKKLLDASRDRLTIHFGFTDAQIGQLEKSGEISSSVTFYSPISGTVLQKEVQQGMYVDEGMTLYQLADLSTVWAYLDVYEKDLRAIKPGQAIGVTTEAYPAKTFNGRVTFIDPVVNPGTRTVRVRTEFANREGLLKPNMFIRAHLSASEAPAVVVPQSAVLSTGPRTVVWVEVQANQFEPRDVVLGAADGGHVEVLRGLREGELVAQTGGFLIDSESALQQPAAADPHAGHNMDGEQAQTGHAAAPAEKNTSNTVKIVVDGGYSPEVVHVRRDTIVRLLFVRKDGGACTTEVEFSDLNIRRELPEGKTTTIELPPQKPGEIHYTCGMGMLHGTVVVD